MINLQVFGGARAPDGVTPDIAAHSAWILRVLGTGSIALNDKDATRDMFVCAVHEGVQG